MGVCPGDTLSRFIWAGPQDKDLQEALRTAAPLRSLGYFWGGSGEVGHYLKRTESVRGSQ